MGGSRRKLKKNRSKVRIGLPKKKPGVFKPAFTVPKELQQLSSGSEWNVRGRVVGNYRSFGVVSNPNLLSVRATTPQIVECSSLLIPSHDEQIRLDDDLAYGSDRETDDVRAALGKRRRDGKAAPLRSLTTMQRVYIGRLIEKYGDNYEAMFMDTKLNAMQHSLATLKKLCQRYNATGKNYINDK